MLTLISYKEERRRTRRGGQEERRRRRRRRQKLVSRPVKLSWIGREGGESEEREEIQVRSEEREERVGEISDR